MKTNTYRNSYANEEIAKKASNSDQFRAVANFIEEISDGVNIVDDAFKYLTVWSGHGGGHKLDETVQNIDTTKFCQLFPFLATSTQRHLREYKELLRNFGVQR